MSMVPSRRWLPSIAGALAFFWALAVLWVCAAWADRPAEPLAEAGAAAAPTAAGDVANEASDSPQNVEFFEKQVRPLLVARCQECHLGDEPKGNLRLASRSDLIAGGDTGPAVVPGNAKASLLVDAINYGDTYQMPPKSKLPATEIAVLTRWVELGAPWPAEHGTEQAEKKKFDLAERRAAHWCWQPVRPSAPPAVQGAAWPASDVDRFVLAKLEEASLQPAAPAAKEVLLRRLSFDLVGLPPTAAEINAFAADTSPAAVANVVDRLLASPQFGERWARHWLDLVRYAETRGHELDPHIPNAWHYRDYVIRALNADVPYDQFLTEHLAGDLLQPPRLDPATGANESILGTGFWFLGEEVHSPVDVRQDEMDRLDNRIDVMTKTFLGLTVACARCHDHKFDAISQRDYYALAGYLISSNYRQVRFETLEQERQLAGQLDALRRSTREQLDAELAAAQRTALEHVAGYLLAAWQAILEGLAVENGSPANGTAPQPAPRLVELAGSKSLDATLLAAWISQLQQARGDATHPLHAFALVAQEAGAAAPARNAELLAPLREKLVTPLRGDVPQNPAQSDAQTIADYADPATPWLQDGFSFGLRPVRRGELLLGGLSVAGTQGGQPDQPTPIRSLQRATAGYAETDPAFKELKQADGNERDFGPVLGWDRSGRTLRTPEFTLGSGKLWYLVRGSGRVYVPVNSHLVISGPLHSALVKHWKTDSPNWQWVEHDLSGYAGHRAHVEFSAHDDGRLAIARVVDSPIQPRPVDEPTRWLAELLTGPSAQSPEALAGGYGQALAAAVKRQDADTGSASDRVALANWWLAHPELWLSADSPAQQRLGQIEQQFVVRQAELAQQIPRQSHTALAMLDGSGMDEHLLIRGNSRTPGDPVPRRLLEALGGGEAPAGADALSSQTGSGRSELARTMLAPTNPLTARVMVNRVWQHLFGEGIVPTVDNFGVLGQKPTHGELLDYLADQFVREGWSVKRLIRSLVLTRSYQMSSQPNPFDEQDPQDALLHRMRIRRLEGEAIRDALLAVSGRLDRKQFGPSVPIHLTPYMEGRGRPAASGPLDGEGRRSIYTAVRRNFLWPMMLAFDMPIPSGTVGRRNVSNVPAQALILMNDPLVVEQAGIWAKRVLAEPGFSPAERVDRLYLDAFAHQADAGQQQRALDFLRRQAEQLGLPPESWQTDARVWSDLAHVLLNSKEFIFVN